jgi:hypothetical protein
MQRGHVFVGKFRVNAHNRNEAWLRGLIANIFLLPCNCVVTFEFLWFCTAGLVAADPVREERGGRILGGFGDGGGKKRWKIIL